MLILSCKCKFKLALDTNKPKQKKITQTKNPNKVECKSMAIVCQMDGRSYITAVLMREAGTSGRVNKDGVNKIRPQGIAEF